MSLLLHFGARASDTSDDVRVETNLRSPDLIAVNTLGQFTEHPRHSPFLLNAMRAEEVRVLYRDDQGFTQVVRACDIQGINEFIHAGASFPRVSAMTPQKASFRDPEPSLVGLGKRSNGN